MRPALARPMPRCIGLLVLLLSLALPVRAAELIVSAASSLSNAFRELAPGFAAANPGTRVLFNFAASDTLLAQIAEGGPADLFASADQQVMDRAATQQLMKADSRRDFIANTMVLITPRGSPLRLSALSDLTSSVVKRVALGRPSGVPAGRYARAALLAAGLWQAVEPKAVYGQNVRQCLDYVARDEVDAGFVYGSDAALMSDKVTIAFVVPTPTPVRYPIAITARSANTVAAQRFIDHLVSPGGQAILARHGFVPR